MMKNLLIFPIVILLLASCSTTKPTASQRTDTRRTNSESQLTFINNISVTPGESNTGSGTSSGKNDYKADYTVSDKNSSNGSIEKYSSLQFKYAILTNAPVEQLRDEKLLNFMDEWYGTKYRYGGTTKSGIDCSAFVSMLMSSVYGITNLPRMARDQYDDSRHIGLDELQQGDLVFFHTVAKKKAVSHVGVYLCNNKFVHASVSGVMISDMNEGYYAQHYVGAGRVR